MPKLANLFTVILSAIMLSAAPLHGAELTDRQVAEDKFEDALHLSLERHSVQRGQSLREAVEAIERAITKEPNEARHWYLKAAILEVQGRREEAETSIRKSILLDPSNPKSHGLLALLLIAGDRKSAAEASLKEALKLDPAYINAHVNLGQLYQNLGKYSEARSHFQKVVDLQSDDWQALSKIVQCSQSLGDAQGRDKARELLLALFKSRAIRAKRFCRERFDTAQHRIMVLEYFEPSGEIAVHYEFIILTPEGKLACRYTMAELEVDTSLARSLHKISDSEHVFSIDRYEPGIQSLVLMMHKAKPPAYEESRELVLADLAKSSARGPRNHKGN